MNDDKRIFALISLGLLLTAILGPFLIAALGRDELAVGFVMVAGLLALLFGVLSWSERIGRTVAVILILLFLVGGTGFIVVSTVSERRARSAAEAQLLRTKAEAERVKAREQAEVARSRQEAAESSR